MADLFQRDKSVISRHIKNLFEEGELRPEGTVAKSATVQTEGGKQVTREIEFYNLDVIISAGYRVKSHRGTQFRIWATQRLREYLVKRGIRPLSRLAGCPASPGRCGLRASHKAVTPPTQTRQLKTQPYGVATPFNLRPLLCAQTPLGVTCL
jgi:Virulence protein RhuM family